MFFFLLFCRLKDKMSVYIVFVIFFFFIGGSGVIFNFFVCFVYFIIFWFLDVFNIFIFNIVVGDLMYLVVVFLMLVVFNVCGEWVFGVEGCMVYGFFIIFFVFGFMMYLVGVVYEWYFMICKLFNDG